MIPFILTTCEASEERLCDAVRTARRVHSCPLPSLRTTDLEPAQGVLQAPASRVAQRCSHCSRASILQVVDGLPTSTPDGSGPMPQAVVIPLGGVAVATAFPQVRARRGLQGPSCTRQGGVGTAQKRRRMSYVWL